MSLTLSGKKKRAEPVCESQNLKFFPAENLQQTMQAFRACLGVMCSYCHVQGDFASDDNPKKETARMMIHMAMDINAKFADGKRHVSCYTCHRGETEPKMTPPAAQ
jgi:hypothetical protein